MNIKITDHLYLRSDQYCCWIVRTSTVKTGKSVGKEVEQIIGYYRTPCRCPYRTFKPSYTHKRSNRPKRDYLACMPA